MRRLPLLVLPDETMLDLHAPGVEIAVDFGIRTFPDPVHQIWMTHKHTGYNILSVRFGETSARYGFIGNASPDEHSSIIRPSYDDTALELYTTH